MATTTRTIQGGMNMKYKLYRRDFEIWKKDIMLFPTIRIFIDNHCYVDENFSIEFHFLCIHARLLFMKER